MNANLMNTAPIMQLPTIRMRKLALSWADNMPATKRDQQYAVRMLRDAKGRGLSGLSLSTALERIESVACEILAARRERSYQRATAARTPAHVHRLPRLTPVARLEHRRRCDVRIAAISNQQEQI
jgi:hypothetical protein